MRLVLLPGLNGSSRLFTPFIDALKGLSIEVLELPDEGPQDYDTLADMLARGLGETPFILIGESFSGPIAYRLALRQPPGLQGLVFAASFLTRPTPLVHLAHRLPIPLWLLSQSLPLKQFCLGKAPPPSSLRLLQQEIRALPQALIVARLHTLAHLQAPVEKLQIPVLHLWPQQDRLVSRSAAASLARYCDDLRHIRIESPHFILQTHAQACADAIRGFMDVCSKKTPAID